MVHDGADQGSNDTTVEKGTTDVVPTTTAVEDQVKSKKDKETDPSNETATAGGGVTKMSDDEDDRIEIDSEREPFLPSEEEAHSPPLDSSPTPPKAKVQIKPDLLKSILRTHHDEEESNLKRNSINYREPTLYDDCMEMWEMGTMMFFLSKMRNLARTNELFVNAEHEQILAFQEIHKNNKEEKGRARVFKSAESKPLRVLRESVSLSEIVETMQECSSAIKDVEGLLPNGVQRVDFHIELMERMRSRGGDRAYELVHFDDFREQEEIVPAIIIDNYRKQVIVAFRGSQSLNDWMVNLSLKQEVVKNPVFRLKKDKKALKNILAGKSAACAKAVRRQPKYMTVASGWYNAIMHESSKFGIGSKYNHIMKKLLQILEEKRDYRVAITGISLGGALSQIFALHIASETNPLIPKPIKCYSMATPKVGAMRFRKAIHALEQLGYLRLLRVMNYDDPILAVPREFMTLCCLPGISTLSLMCQQGLFYRKAGMELSLRDDEIHFTHAMVCH